MATSFKQHAPLIATLLSRGAVTLGIVFWNLVHARLLTASEFGLITLCYAIVLAISYLSRIGLDVSLIQFIAEFKAAGKPQQAGRLTFVSILFALALAFVAMAILQALAAGLESWLSMDGFAEAATGISWALPWVTVSGVLMGYYRGSHGFVAGNLMDSGGLLTISAVVAMILGVVGDTFNLAIALDALVLSCFLVFAAGFLGFLWRERQSGLFSLDIDLAREKYFRISLNLMLMVFISYLLYWGGVLVVGYYMDAASVGVFGILVRLCLFVAFVAMVLNNIIPTWMADLFSRGEIQQLRELVNRYSWVGLLSTLPPGLLLLCFPDFFIGLFGSEFVSNEATSALRVFVLFQILSVLTFNGMLLARCSGHDHVARNSSVISAVVSIGFAVMLTPPYGLVGAAIGAGLGMTLINVICAISCYRQLDINVLPRFKV